MQCFGECRSEIPREARDDVTDKTDKVDFLTKNDIGSTAGCEALDTDF